MNIRKPTESAKDPPAAVPCNTTKKPANAAMKVERSFNALKQWRGLATRYDKLAQTYRAAGVLQAVFIFLLQRPM